MFNMNEIVGNMNVLFMTLDTLRLDVAQQLFREGRLPNFARVCPEGWVAAHTPASFTYAAHQAFFAGFLPTPAHPGKHIRLFAAKFQGSETTGESTCVLDAADIVTGLAQKGYQTVCIGGVGFFNKKTPLGSVLPRLFQESYWEESFGVTDPDAAENQFRFAATLLDRAVHKPMFLFINVSAIHQPNCFYLPGAQEDSMDSHAAALEYVDAKLPLLFSALKQKQQNTFCILCSDHGTAYGEDNYWGHRIGHETVWNVPYASFILKSER